MNHLHLPILALSLAAFSVANAVEEPNYDEHIKPIFRQHCLKCHGDDKQKADLNLQNYESTMRGGSGGEAIAAGRSSQSLLFDIITDPDDDARMPPNKPPIPQDQIDVIQKWIDTGVRQSSSSTSMIESRDTSFAPSTGATEKPEHPAMPENLPDIETPDTVRPLPALTLASSPWSPLVAVAGQEHIRLFHTETQQELGRILYPEGVPHVIRFSQNGEVLMVAGGQPVQSGNVVLFDVKSGSRLASIGDEVDAVLAADLIADQSLVALGGSGKVVKVYSTSDGKLQYKIDKHTDWITAVAFSPDGNSLVTADRSGGIHLWDARSGGIRLSLLEHKAAVRSLAWRSDSKFLASVGEDGRIVWWDTTDGWPAINKTRAHQPKRPEGTFGEIPNGILAADFGTNGNLATAGRDQKIRVWDTKGNQVKKVELPDGLPLSTTLHGDGSTLVVGDSLGRVHFWKY